jgi:hypothetical protein
MTYELYVLLALYVFPDSVQLSYFTREKINWDFESTLLNGRS